MQGETRGAFGSADITADHRIMRFLVMQSLMKARHSLPVRVEAVTNDGGVSPVGYVDIRPLIQQIDGDANAVDHGVVHNVPYMRIQGGANAVILDPQVGDIGIAVFCDRDISTLKATKKAALPGSRRANHMADAVYLHTIIAGAPTQYVRFSAAGISLVSPVAVQIQAPNIGLHGNVTASGGTLTHNGVNVGSTHAHGGVQPGSGTSGAPVS